MVSCLVFAQGCKTTGAGTDLSYNMKQAVSRSAGDVAMTALLDDGADAKQAGEYVQGLVKLFEVAKLDKATFRMAAHSTAKRVGLTDAADYIDVLVSIVPSDVGEIEQIPLKYRKALLSFLQDGALRALALYTTEE